MPGVKHSPVMMFAAGPSHSLAVLPWQRVVPGCPCSTSLPSMSSWPCLSPSRLTAMATLTWIEWIAGLLLVVWDTLSQRFAARHIPARLPLPPLPNLTVMITGATSGIGLHTARFSSSLPPSLPSPLFPSLRPSLPCHAPHLSHGSLLACLAELWPSPEPMSSLPSATRMLPRTSCLNGRPSNLQASRPLIVRYHFKRDSTLMARLFPQGAVIHCICTFSNHFMPSTKFRRLRFLFAHFHQFILLSSVGYGAGLPIIWLCPKTRWNLGGSKAAAEFVDQQRRNILYDGYLFPLSYKFMLFVTVWYYLICQCGIWLYSLIFNVKSILGSVFIWSSFCMLIEPQKFSKDGCEQHMQVNHLAPALLTVLLLPSLARGAPSRVVMVNSIVSFPICSLFSESSTYCPTVSGMQKWVHLFLGSSVIWKLIQWSFPMHLDTCNR